MRVWVQLAWVCAFAVGCGGPLTEEPPPEEVSEQESSDEGAPGEVSAQWNRTKLGTPFLVEDIFPPLTPAPPPLPIEGPLPTDLVDFRGTLFFAANFTSGESALWRSDGTAPGTFAVREFEVTGVSGLTVVGRRLFFVASDSVHGTELWVSDGTTAGTRLLRDITPGGVSSELEGLTRVGDTLFFYRRLSSETSGERLELWRSDGTEAGTVRVKELGPGFALFELTALDDDTLFFVADDGEHGFEPWVSDGTARGTRLLRDIRPGPDSSGVMRPTRVDDGLLYFSAEEPAHGRELWRTDGTRRGTELVEDTVPGPEGSGAQPIALFKRRLYFVTFEPADRGARLRKLDPDPDCHPRSTVIEDLPNPFPDFPQVSAFLPAGGIAEVNGRLLFTLAYSTSGPALADVQLWATRGTARTTELLRRRLVNAIDIPVATLTAVNEDLALFAAADAEHGQEPWVTDGTLRGTRLLMDINPGPANAFPFDFTRSGDFMFFVANDGVHFHELWAVPVGDTRHRAGR
ncbi:MAG TPA: ELWxxDGT repeat protein [Archangium sp.]|jgi:ELWxxDGT repeat protein|uniref:ELWxxDGT repeat protein n=1 Tax=Archangium sp. TaxID=1872627 RepID=UPI002EDAC119